MQQNQRYHLYDSMHSSVKIIIQLYTTQFFLFFKLQKPELFFPYAVVLYKDL